MAALIIFSTSVLGAGMCPVSEASTAVVRLAMALPEERVYWMFTSLRLLSAVSVRFLAPEGMLTAARYLR